MKQYVVLVSVVVIMVGMCLSGCTETKTGDQRFVGTWVGTFAWAGQFNHTVPTNLTFFVNGTYHASMPFRIETGTWSVDHGNLTKTIDSQSPETYTFTFSNDNSKLLLTSSSQEFQWNLTKMSITI